MNYFILMLFFFFNLLYRRCFIKLFALFSILQCKFAPVFPALKKLTKEGEILSEIFT